jgi:hypothetical protein
VARELADGRDAALGGAPKRARRKRRAVADHAKTDDAVLAYSRA